MLTIASVGAELRDQGQEMLLSYVDKLPTGFVLLNLSFLLCLFDQRMISRSVVLKVVAELQETAMEKQGLDMHVAALVSVHKYFILCQSSISNLWFQQIL